MSRAEKEFYKIIAGGTSGITQVLMVLSIIFESLTRLLSKKDLFCHLWLDDIYYNTIINGKKRITRKTYLLL
jgi:hypothetical protein